ncbi:MAG: hypothetical protein ABIJ96_04900 [Elusimicrobiota bacterium]
MTDEIPENRVKTAIQGILGALAGALIGHGAVALSQILTARTASLRPPDAPTFFTLALYTACLYGGLGAGIFRGPERLRGAVKGFGTAAVLIAAPLIPATYLLRTGGGGAANYAFVHLLVYMGASLATVWVLGAGARNQGLLRGWKAGLGAVLGALAAQILSAVISAILPGLRVYPLGPLPPPAMLIEAILCGALVALGIRLLAPAEKD